MKVADVPKVALVGARSSNQVFSSDDLLESSLRELDISPSRLCWDDPTVDWDSFDLVVIRSCWDYHLRQPEFLAWTRWLEARGIKVANPASVIAWNSDKRYLLKLAADGIAMPESCVVTGGDTRTIGELCDAFGTDDLVIKPLVSADAYWTWRVRGTTEYESERRLDWLRARGGALVQHYISDIEQAGELSLVFVTNQFCHAVRKLPASGDFRAQPGLNASVNQAHPDKAVQDFALQVLDRVEVKTLFARIDIVESRHGPLLMELELIEPELYLRASPETAQAMASAIREQLQAARTMEIGVRA